MKLKLMLIGALCALLCGCATEWTGLESPLLVPGEGDYQNPYSPIRPDERQSWRAWEAAYAKFAAEHPELAAADERRAGKRP